MSKFDIVRFRSAGGNSSVLHLLVGRSSDSTSWPLTYQLHLLSETAISDFSIDGDFLHQAYTERVTQIITGLQTAREIESTDPALADLLYEIDYEYKALYCTQPADEKEK